MRRLTSPWSLPVLVLLACNGGTATDTTDASSSSSTSTSTGGACIPDARNDCQPDSSSGDALAGVTIVVTSEGTAAQSALTDGNGFYKITDLAPGSYLVTFYYLDFTVERPVVVGVQKVTAVYQKLNTNASKGEVVKVEGTAPTIAPTSTAQGITIDKNYIKNTPGEIQGSRTSYPPSSFVLSHPIRLWELQLQT